MALAGSLAEQVEQRMALAFGDFHLSDRDILDLSLQERRLFLESRSRVIEDMRSRMEKAQNQSKQKK
jgi:hypothetical protein